MALTRQNMEIPGFTVCHSPAEVLELAKKHPRAFVIGGGSVYREMLPYCDRAYVTRVHLTPESDTFFPNLEEDAQWYLAETLQSGEENGVFYEMQLFRRK